MKRFVIIHDHEVRDCASWKKNKTKINKRVRGARWLKITNMSKINIASRRSYCVYRRSAGKQKIQCNTTAQGFSSIGAFVFVCMVLTGVLYLFSTNSMAIKGDSIYQIEQEIQELARENEQLIIMEAQLRSLENVEDIINDKDMKEITQPVYIERELRVALD